MSLFSLLSPAETPVEDYPFVPSDVALYQRTLGRPAALDEQTWDDTLLQPYSAHLARQTSIFGQQELHRRLHADSDAGALAASIVRVRALVSDDGQRQLLHRTFDSVRRADREVSEHLFGEACIAQARPRWTPLLHWLPVVFLLSPVLALALGWLPLWGVVVALWLLLMAVQMRFRDEAEEWFRINRSVQLMLRAHSLLARLESPLAAPFRTDAPPRRQDQSRHRSVADAQLAGRARIRGLAVADEYPRLFRQPRSGARERRVPAS